MANVWSTPASSSTIRRVRRTASIARTLTFPCADVGTVLYKASDRSPRGDVGRRVITFAGLLDERGPFHDVDAATPVCDRALRPELSQRDGDGMSRAADQLRQRFMGDGQRTLPRLVGRDQQPSRPTLAVRMY